MLRKHFKTLVSRQCKKAALKGYVYDFSFDFDAFAVDYVLAIYKYLWKRIIWYKSVWVY